MRKSDEVVKTATSSPVQGRTPASEPVCKPISLAFSPVVPHKGGVVTGLLAIQGVAIKDCPVYLTSLNPNVFTPQKQVIVSAGSTTAIVTAVYTPSGKDPVVYVFASNDYGKTPAVGIPVNTATQGFDRDGGDKPGPDKPGLAPTYDVTSLTYPPITATGTVIGHVSITPVAGKGGVDVSIASDSALFQPQQNQIHIPSGKDSAEVPTTVVVLSTPYTANVAASANNVFGPIPIIVPTPPPTSPK